MSRSVFLGLLCAAFLAGCSDKAEEPKAPPPPKAAPAPVIPEQPAVDVPKTVSHYVRPTEELRRSEAAAVARAVEEAKRLRSEKAESLLIERFVPTEKRVFFSGGDAPVPAPEAQAEAKAALAPLPPQLERYRRLSDRQLLKEVRLRFNVKKEGGRTVYEAKGFGKGMRRQMSTTESPARNNDRASLGFGFAVNDDGTAEAAWTFEYAGATELQPKALYVETASCRFPIPMPQGRTVSTEVLSDGAKRALFSAAWEDGSAGLFTALLLAHRQESGALTVRGGGSEIDVYGFNIENRRLMTEAQLLFAVLKEKAFFGRLSSQAK